MQLYAEVLPFLLRVADAPPKDEDVTAGWLAFAVFAALIVAVVLLGFSLVKQLRKAAAAKEAGVYDDPDAPESHPTS
jgi:hypothetical protein